MSEQKPKIYFNLSGFERYLSVSKRLEKATIRKRLSSLKVYFTYCSTHNVSYNEATENFLFELQDKVSAGTLNNHIKALKALDEYCTERLNQKSFTKDLKYFKTTKPNIEPLTREEKDLLYTYPVPDVRASSQERTRQIHSLYKDLTLLLDMTGLRFEDAISLTVQNVQGDMLVFTQHKTKKNIAIPLVSPLKEVIYTRIKEKFNNCLIFTSSKETKLIRHKYSEWLKEAGKYCGIKDYKHRCHPHNFRRAFATELNASGVSTRDIQELMGHEQIESTSRYIYPNQKQLRDSVKKLPLTKRFSSPKDVMHDLIEAIRTFKLDEDKRFTYSLKEENKKLIMELELVE